MHDTRPSIPWTTVPIRTNYATTIDKVIVRDNSAFWNSGSPASVHHAAVETGQANPNLDFPSVAANGGTQDLTVTVTGGRAGDAVAVTCRSALNAGLVPQWWVSGNDTVTIRLTNCTGAAINSASMTWDVAVRKRSA